MEQIGVRRVNDDQPSPLVNFLDQPLEVPRAGLEGVQELRSALRGCTDEDVLLPAAQIERLRAFLTPVFARRYDAAAARMRDIEQLEILAQGYETRGRFLSELTLDPPSSTGELAGPPLLDEDYLILSTIHSAKGLEWDAVHVIHAADGMIPSDMATGNAEEIEEERRLLYVAMTRAKDQLMLLLPQRFYVHQQARRGDKHLYASRTRFIPGALASHFEMRSWLAGGRGSQAGAPRTTATIDIGARMRQMWRGTGT
jgi:DNA helicase-2/ATP-dependent DNA helicase PcrA